MKRIFYEKVGRRYKPVYEYDQLLMDSFPKGAHLVLCYPGGQSRRFNVDPNHAAMIAAGRLAEDAISKVIMDATALRPSRTPITEGQRRAWTRLSKEFGDEIHMLQWPSAREAAEKAVQAIQDEALTLMQHPAVQQAYEQFQLVCELTKQHQNHDN
jgi:hypothetical protein